jgi:hypothetical protein
MGDFWQAEYWSEVEFRHPLEPAVEDEDVEDEDEEDSKLTDNERLHPLNRARAKNGISFVRYPVRINN